MALLISILTDVIHILKFFLLSSSFFMFQKRKNKYKILKLIEVLSLIIIFSILIYYCKNPILSMLLYCIFTVGLMVYVYKEKVVIITLSVIWMIFVLGMLDIMSDIFVKMLFNLLGNTNVGFHETIASSISLIFVFFTGQFYKKKSRIGLKNVEIKYLVFFLIIAIVDAIVITLIAAGIDTLKNINLVISLCFVVMGIFLMLAFLIVLFVQRNESKEQEAVIKRYLNEQKNYYKYLELRERETKKFRHDLRSHMDTMCHLVKNQDYDEFIKYFDTVNTKIENFGNGMTVYNGIADAIINQYYSAAQSMGINMKVGGRFPVECNVDAYDICTIFSNILSNAIEAATDTEEKLVILECRHTNDNELFISISNSFINVGQFKNGIIKSHKRDSDYHGYGMENVKDSVNKYDGFMNITIKENVFELKITLYY